MSKINICGIPHNIEYVDDIFQSDSIHFGEFNPESCTIYINKNLPDGMRQQTLLHEMVHAIFLHIGRTDLYGDEDLVQALANALNTCVDPREKGRKS